MGASYPEQAICVTNGKLANYVNGSENTEKKTMHICFVALNSYNLFTSSKSLTHIGGAEMQQYLMARWLVDAGHRVTIVTLDHGQAREEFINGIRIVKAYDVKKGLPIIRFLTPRWRKLISALRFVDADIYYQRGASLETGQVAYWCQSNQRAFVFASASESDCDPALPFLSKSRERFLFRRGLKLASGVVVQSKRQAELLDIGYGIPSEVIYSSGRTLGEPIVPSEKGNRVIWLGRFSPQKRFEWVLDIAAASKNYDFLVLGASNVGSSYSKAMMDRAAALPNVKLVGHVPKSNVIDYYNQAKFLILTSPIEGFPNVFLEAWQLGIPVITTFDPDGVVETNRLGWHVGSPQDAVALLRKYEFDETELHTTAERVANYYKEHHTTDKNMPIYLSLFQRLISST